MAQPQKAEELVWRGNPSQVRFFGTYVLCVLFCWLIVPIFIALWKWLVNRYTVYEITSQRLRYTTGIFSRQTDQIELYRIKDMRLIEPFFLRLFGCGNIVMETSDKSDPVFTLTAVPDAKTLLDKMRLHVEKRRDEKRVREIDFET